MRRSMLFFYDYMWILLTNLDRPSPPEDVVVQRTGDADLLNISWTATSLVGVDQNYAIIFDTHMVETTYLYYIYQQNTYTVRCGTFLAFIKAVNGAGESDPSNNVTIPSLPHIAPVTASLRHQVWKSRGEIMVSVSFEVSSIQK